MRQEDYNDMMKTSDEAYLLRVKPSKRVKIYCPNCGEAYLGNGIDLCVECQAEMPPQGLEV
jgi:predicted RNA-binding Zn-ribbon protein involved in translation (DUF1610 family)